MPFDITGIGAVSSLIKDVADKIWPDPAIRAQYLLKAQELDNQLMAGQLAINQSEATNENLFVAGWRPFIGWVCGLAFAYHFILQPAVTYGVAIYGHKIELPVFDMRTLDEVLMGMLGFGALRTGEKMGDKGHLPWQK